MAIIREYGYREYSDDLTPAADGRSNLLFNEDRSLVTHADFHRVEPDEDNDEDLAGVDPQVVGNVLAAVGVIALATGAVYLTKLAVRRVKQRLRARHASQGEEASTAEDEQGATTNGDVGHSQETSTDVEVVDAQEALIEEVSGLCGDKATSAAQTSRVPEPEVEQDVENERRAPRPAKLRRRPRP